MKTTLFCIFIAIVIFGCSMDANQKAPVVVADNIKHKELAETLLRTILKPAETDIRDNWSKMEVNFWSHRGKCKESPVGEHVYLHNYGEKNPNRGIQECLCCGKIL